MTGAQTTEPPLWLVHNDQPQLGLVEHEFISIGWPMMGDLAIIGNDQEAMKQAVAPAHRRDPALAMNLKAERRRSLS